MTSGTKTKANTPIKVCAEPRVNAKGQAVYFDPTDFPYGANAPQDLQDYYAPQESQEPQEPQDRHDSHEPHDSHDLDGASLTITEAERPSAVELAEMPFSEYLMEVLHYTEQERQEQKPSKFRTPLFTFARFCKFHPSVRELPSYAAMKRVHETMRGWSDVPGRIDPWEHFFPDAGLGEAARIDFQDSWEKVRSLPFQDALQDALRLAIDYPLGIPDDRGPLYVRFVSVAYWLQQSRGNLPIMLPTRKLDSMLGCDHRTISSLRRMAVGDGFLRETKQYRFQSGGKGEATEFEFLTDRLNKERDAA
jgi:hypothetical protein